MASSRALKNEIRKESPPKHTDFQLAIQAVKQFFKGGSPTSPPKKRR